jgi:hypothetical protein
MPDKKASVRPFFAGGREQIKLPVKSNRGGWGGTGVSQNRKKVSEIWQRSEEFRLAVSLSGVGLVCAK